MGRFVYDGTAGTEIEDRTLAHLRIVIANKLRRGEHFLFTWRDTPSTGGGRTCVWLAPECPLVFKFYGGREPQVNRLWLEALAAAANSPTGLYIVPEPEPSSRCPELPL